MLAPTRRGAAFGAIDARATRACMRSSTSSLLSRGTETRICIANAYEPCVVFSDGLSVLAFALRRELAFNSFIR